MPVIPSGYAEISWHMNLTGGNQKAVTAIGVQLSAADPLEVLNGAETAFDDNFTPIICDQWEGEDIVLNIGPQNPGTGQQFNFGPWAGGGNATDCLPPNCATLIKKRSNLGGRKNRGRMFLPSPTEAGTDELGGLSGTQLDDVTNFAAAFLLELQETNGVTRVVILHTDEADAPTTVESMVPDPKIATQRRRMR